MVSKNKKSVNIISTFLTFLLAIAITLCGFGETIALAACGPEKEMGAWETIPLPPPSNRMQSVHTILLPNGKVLTLNGSSFRTTLTKDENGNNKFIEGVDVTDDKIVDNTGLLDPVSGQFKRTSTPPAMQFGESNDLFCSGHVQLANGNVLFIGGTGRYYPGGAFTGSRQVNIYDWKTDTWSAVGQLKQGRWYPSLIPLADGKVVIFSGLKLDAPNQINPSLEIYDPSTGKISYVDLTKIKNSPFNTKLKDVNSYDSIDLYPRVFPTADGRLLITGDDGGIGGVLVSQSSKKTYLMSIKDNGDNNFSVSFEVGPEKGETSKAYGTALQVPNSEDVLLLGGIIGTNDINFGRGGKTEGFPAGSRVADSLQRWVSPQKSGEKNGKWEIVDHFLDKPRANLEAVILPTKEILVVNGGEYPEYKPVYEPLLMTPDDQVPGGYTKKSMNPAKLPRLYHNGAVLLPDARVLVTGGNANRASLEKDGTVHVNVVKDPTTYYKFPELNKEFSIEEYYKSPQSYFLVEGDSQPFVPAEIWQAEIFSPPYLFQPGLRPEIVQVPTTLNYGRKDGILVKNATEKGSVVLVKLGAVTHSFDYGQKLAELSNVNVPNVMGDKSLIVFKTPENANLYPPGYYMMFYLNNLGKPSIAKMVKLEKTETTPQ
ncbi:galactose oxidase early set domain-containing protein [Cylindrospermopsis raciborskii]|uniref:galactose oxidase early set domain-containing protein n=1 Tax=Cylindrospermopsis raciborskii TaxID=77022 RepID=UPI000778B15B|nr:galactose oxidase early set domain-containing protein [Cylindrospermopsis raciborskii]MCZ2201356.1 galactose oxidase early set domain-containing protein [Cylindrospermopsis raciborskii PAMP2012]MCZ2206170.1 galactose oxidase early set domain-containing protein [Cylindrospermopsis raciborskii PAMP2011]